MSSEKIYCVPNCGSEKEILHKFPNPNKEPERFRTWIYNIGGSVLALDNDIIFKRRRVCHLHFEPRYHTGSKFLSADAIPRLYLPGFTLMRRPPLMDVTNQGTSSSPAEIFPAQELPMELCPPSTKRKNGILPEETKDMADFIIFIDYLFDSLNGSMKNSGVRSGKDLLRNVTPKSKHKDIWVQAKAILKSMTFMTSKGSAGTVPSITNWIKTIDNMGILRDKLFNEFNIKSFWCRHFNQDPLENFFGSIRSHGVRNNSPTCAGFEAAFASLLVNNMSSNYSPGSNCEEDFCSTFESFDELFFSQNKKEEMQCCEVDYNDLNDNIIIDFNTKKKDPRIIGQLEYVTGYILRKAKKIYKNCKDCKIALYTDDQNENRYLQHREYIKGKRYLCYPSQNLTKCFSAMQDILHHILRNKSHITNLKNYMKTILYVNVNTEFIQCTSHKKELIEFMFDFSSRFFTHNWCKWTNKLLNGTSTSKDVDSTDEIQNQALIYYSKRRKNKQSKLIL